MPSKALVPDDKYSGLYVALKSSTDNKIMASGKNRDYVLQKATDRGAEKPVIVFVPETTTCIYLPDIMSKKKFDLFNFDYEKIRDYADSMKDKNELIEYLNYVKNEIVIKQKYFRAEFEAERGLFPDEHYSIEDACSFMDEPFMIKLNGAERIVDARLEIHGKTEPKKDIVEKIPWHGTRGELARLIKLLIQKGYLKTSYRHKFTEKFFCKGNGENFNPRTQSSAEDDTSEDKLNAIDELVNKLQG